MSDPVQAAASDFKLRPEHAAGAVALLREGASVPFIARYRKERTGGLGPETLNALRERLRGLDELEARRGVVLNSIHALGRLEDSLRAKVEAAATRAELEDLYLPFGPQPAKSRAQLAREQGLEPLADLIQKQETASGSVEALAMPFLSGEKGVKELGEALSGAREIVASRLAEDPGLRAEQRQLLAAHGKLTVQPHGRVDLAKTRYAAMAGFSEPLAKAPPHRLLTVVRGERDKKLVLQVEAPREKMREALLARAQVRTASIFAAEFVSALDEALDRLLIPALRAEALQGVRARAEAAAAELFTRHLRALLLHPPLGPKRVLAVVAQPQVQPKPAGGKAVAEAAAMLSTPDSAGDSSAAEEAVPPAAEGTGGESQGAEGLGSGGAPEPPGEPEQAAGKVLATPRPGGLVLWLAALDGSGKILAHAQTAPFLTEAGRAQARETLEGLLRTHQIEAVAIDHGKAGREVEAFVREALNATGLGAAPCALVSEAGAAAYASSRQAKQEWPDLDPAERATAFLGRRLQDPLAEWLKVDLKTCVGGTYRQDLEPRLLRRKTEETVEACVAEVGADVNTAGVELLSHLPGLGPARAQALVAARTARGGFKSREELKALPGFDGLAWERVAGLLRVRGGTQPLDATAIHPEHYGVVQKMAAVLGVEVAALLGNPEQARKIDPAAYVGEGWALETLREIVAELQNPGRDPRGAFVAPVFNAEVRALKDLQAGQTLNGVVTHVAAFGVFVDVGVRQDGLVHISELTHRFVKDPGEVVKEGQAVKVKVIGVDVALKRVSLSLKALEAPAPPKVERRPRPARSPRPAPAARPPSTGTAAASTGAGGAGASATAGTGRPRGSGPRPVRSRTPGRGPGRPAAAAAGTAPVGAAGSPSAASPGGPAGQARAGAPAGRGRGPGTGAGRGGPGGRKDRDAKVSHGPRVSASGKPLPDYSKFFVKGKRKENRKKRDARGGPEASRQEVHEVIRAQERTAPTLGDLLKKAGVKPDEE